jgi:hypothetical protein
MRGSFDVVRTCVILEGGRDVSPTEFERLAGKAASKKWKASIRIDKVLLLQHPPTPSQMHHLRAESSCSVTLHFYSVHACWVMALRMVWLSGFCVTAELQTVFGRHMVS